MKRSPVTPCAISAVTILLIIGYFSSYYLLTGGLNSLPEKPLMGWPVIT